MMIGLGQASTASTTPAVTPTGTTSGTTQPTFTTGLQLWSTPSTAFSTMGSAFSNPSTAFSSAYLPYTAGLFLPPVALVAVLFIMGSKKGR